MHPLRRLIETQQSLEEEDWQRIEDCLQFLPLRKGECLLLAGQAANRLYFLEKGRLEGSKHRATTVVVMKSLSSPVLFSAETRFLERKPVPYTIEAGENSNTWSIGYEDVKRLLTIPAWKNFLRKRLCFPQALPAPLKKGRRRI